MRKTEPSFQNQGASINNLETQVDQIAVAISGRVPGTLPSNIKVNPNKSVTVVTTKSGVQLPEIYVKRSVENKEKVSPTDEEHVEQTEQISAIKESSGTPQVKATVPVRPFELPISFP
ncbi:Uncharacterized protein Adt_39920 [Abeliophyllum distichum]|uniref:Uncharacterized protein n=1 Tax=Abeliophyllum distichum TaxID=126358 RepID=A0ABD1Q6F8_9LAMI